jgi:hypothetical protein
MQGNERQKFKGDIMSDFNEQLDIESEEFILYVMKRFKYSRDKAETHRDNILKKLKEDK